MSVTHLTGGFVVNLDRVAEGVLAMLSKIAELGYEQLRDLPTAGERRRQNYGAEDCRCSPARDFAELARVMHQNQMLQLAVAQQPYDCGLGFLPRRRATAEAPAVSLAAAPATQAPPMPDKPMPALPDLREVFPSLAGMLPTLDALSPVPELAALGVAVRRGVADAFQVSPEEFLGKSLTAFGLEGERMERAKQWLRAETGILPLIRDRAGHPVLKDASEYVREAEARAGPDEWPPMPPPATAAPAARPPPDG